MDKLVYDGWMKLYKRQIENRTYEILKNHDAVAIFLLNNKKEVLLVKQYRPALLQDTLEIPAGVMDMDGESFEKCAVRELKEETGYTVDEKDLKKIVSYKPMMGFSNSTMYIYMTEIDEIILNSREETDDKDVTGCLWVPIDTLGQYIEAGKILDSKTLMAYYYYQSSVK